MAPTRAAMRLAVVAGLIVTSACKAGPSAFDRGQGEDAGSAADTSEVGVELREPTPVDTPSLAGRSSDAPVPGPDPVRSENDAQGSADDAEIDAVSIDSREAAEASERDKLLPSSSVQRFPRPAAVRGLYLNAWAAGSRRRVEELLDIARTTEINSFVIDIKDASGFISHRTKLPLAAEIGSTEEIRIRDLPALLDTLEAAGIYPIARIVIVKDPLLAASRPDFAIQDSAGVWTDPKDVVWLNPYNRGVWDYHVALASEVAELGFPEIQWDYIRFPDAPKSYLARAVYPGAEGRSREEALRAFFEYADDALSKYGVEMTADVFGVTTTASRDVGIGQVWESFIDVVDVALPMVYPSHYWEGSFGIDTPNAYPYEVVREALYDATRKSQRVPGAGATRPWLQDFTLGAPRYEAPEVRAQIQAAYDVGIDEWILWNPGSHYTNDALEPVGGFGSEVMIRVAGQIVPVSERFEYVDSIVWATPEVPPEDVLPDTSAIAPDTVIANAEENTPIVARGR